MEKVNQYLNSYLNFPNDLDTMRNLLSDDFRGIFVRNRNEVHYCNKEEFVNFFSTRHTLSSNSVIKKNRINELENGVFFGLVVSHQNHIVDSNDNQNDNQEDKLFRIRDNVLFKFDNNGKLCFIEHRWISRPFDQKKAEKVKSKKIKKIKARRARKKNKSKSESKSEVTNETSRNLAPETTTDNKNIPETIN